LRRRPAIRPFAQHYDPSLKFRQRTIRDAGPDVTNGDDAVIRLLRVARSLAAVGQDDVTACARRFRQSRLGKGVLLFAGDPGANLHFVSEGQVRIAVATAEGLELSFEIVAPGGVRRDRAARWLPVTMRWVRAVPGVRR